MKRSLVIGMGIGQLYKTVLEKIGHEVITVDSDPNKSADFTDVYSALLKYPDFHTVHICTPNFTHRSIAELVARFTKILFIEKPGLENATEWKQLVTSHPNTRIMMVKNNMWRDNIPEIAQCAKLAETVNIMWVRENCVPHPGSWFTTKKLAFGGVSRDLMPHLLSLYVALNPNWRTDPITIKYAKQFFKLSDITSTEYGIINPNGTYDVDDACRFKFAEKWNCLASWKSDTHNDSSISCYNADDEGNTFELGWCPEGAYHHMIVDAMANMDNDKFWSTQHEIDTWIHERLDNL